MSWKNRRSYSSKFTAQQKASYHSGRGYRLGRERKGINFKNPANRASFSAGYNSVDPSRYPSTKR